MIFFLLISFLAFVFADKPKPLSRSANVGDVFAKGFGNMGLLGSIGLTATANLLSDQYPYFEVGCDVSGGVAPYTYRWFLYGGNSTGLQGNYLSSVCGVNSSVGDTFDVACRVTDSVGSVVLSNHIVHSV